MNPDALRTLDAIRWDFAHVFALPRFWPPHLQREFVALGRTRAPIPRPGRYGIAPGTKREQLGRRLSRRAIPKSHPPQMDITRDKGNRTSHRGNGNTAIQIINGENGANAMDTDPDPAAIGDNWGFLRYWLVVSGGELYRYPAGIQRAAHST